MDFASRLYYQYIARDADGGFKLHLDQDLVRRVTKAITVAQRSMASTKQLGDLLATIERSFIKIQNFLEKEMRKEPRLHFFRTFTTAAMEIETLEKNCPLPTFIFQELEREDPFAPQHVKDGGDDWEPMEDESDTEGVRGMKKFYEGHPYCCAKCMGMVPAPAQQVLIFSFFSFSFLFILLIYNIFINVRYIV